MLAPRNQDTLRQLQPKTPGARYPKTPIKVPLNDENAAHVVGGAKGNLTGRSRGNENALTSKAVKGFDKSNFVTPMGKFPPYSKEMISLPRSYADKKHRTPEQSSARKQDNQRQS